MRVRANLRGWCFVLGFVFLEQVAIGAKAFAAGDLHERWADPRRLLADVLGHVKASPNAYRVTDRSLAVYCRPETGFHQIYGRGMTFRADPANFFATSYRIAVFEQGNAVQPDGRVDTRALSYTVEKTGAAPELGGAKAKIKVRLCATRGYPIPTNLSVSLFDRQSKMFITKGHEVYPIAFSGKFSNPIDVDGFEVDGVATFREGLDYLLKEIIEEEGH